MLFVVAFIQYVSSPSLSLFLRPPPPDSLLRAPLWKMLMLYWWQLGSAFAYTRAAAAAAAVGERLHPGALPLLFTLSLKLDNYSVTFKRKGGLVWQGHVYMKWKMNIDYANLKWSSERKFDGFQVGLWAEISPKDICVYELLDNKKQDKIKKS